MYSILNCPLPFCANLYSLKVQLIFYFYILRYFPKIICLNGKKDLKRETQCNFLLKKETFQIKRDPKCGLGLLRNPVGSSAWVQSFYY